MAYVTELFDSWNKAGVRYCIRGKYSHIPKVGGSDIDILIRRKDFGKVKRLLRSESFYFYPHTQPNLFFFKYIAGVGMVHLDILLSDDMPSVRKEKNFFVLSDRKCIKNEKFFLQKVQTGFVRRLTRLFRGKVFSFEGPDGSGKSTFVREVFSELRRVGFSKDVVHFATSRNRDGSDPSSSKRLFTRLLSVFRVWYGRVLGRVVLTDRYIFLTFRKSPFFRSIIRFLSPKPDILFVMHASVPVIHKRKLGQRDCLSAEKIRELYAVYNSAPCHKRVVIDTTKNLEGNKELIINSLLSVMLPLAK